MENEAQYFTLINWLMGANTIPVIGFAVLCFVWAGIARTPSKKSVFSAAGGMLILFVVLRVAVIMLPTNLVLLVIIGILHGVMMIIMFGVFMVVTTVVRRARKEMQLAEQCRKEACESPAVQKWNAVESKLLALGREAGWL